MLAESSCDGFSMMVSSTSLVSPVLVYFRHVVWTILMYFGWYLDCLGCNSHLDE